MEEIIMIQRINLAISKARVGIFCVAALYYFTFWIIDMVNGFKLSGGTGVKIMFQELFSMGISLVMLAVLLEVSRKIAEKYTQADFAAPAAPRLNYNTYGAAPQAPVQPQMQVPPQAPVPPQASVPPQPNAAPPVIPPVADPASSGVWFCSGCGTKNEGVAAFCAKCGKPK